MFTHEPGQKRGKAAAGPQPEPEYRFCARGLRHVTPYVDESLDAREGPLTRCSAARRLCARVRRVPARVPYFRICIPLGPSSSTARASTRGDVYTHCTRGRPRHAPHAPARAARRRNVRRDARAQGRPDAADGRRCRCTRAARYHFNSLFHGVSSARHAARTAERAAAAAAATASAPAADADATPPAAAPPTPRRAPGRRHSKSQTV